MQIVLDVKSTDLDKEVTEILSCLSPEQKSEMAYQLVNLNLNSVSSELKVSAVREKIIAEYAEKDKHIRWNDVKNEWEVKNRYYDYSAVGWEEREALAKETSAKLGVNKFFRSDVLSALLTDAKAHCATAVKESPEMQEAIALAISAIKEEIPALVKQAMVLQFAQQLETCMATIRGSHTAHSSLHDQLVVRLQNKIGSF